jgi:hypothetical protein
VKATAMTYPDAEHDRPARRVSGDVLWRHVPFWDNFEVTVEGVQVNPKTVRLLNGKPAAWPGDARKAATNAFCPTGEGGGVDPSCSPSGLKLPTKPKFISKQSSNVEENQKAVAKMEELGKQAAAGDAKALADLKAYPGTPSPKVKEYKGLLLKAVKAHLTPPSPVQETVPQVQQPAPPSSSLKLHMEKVLDKVTKDTGYDKEQLRKNLLTDLNMRSKVSGSILTSGLSRKDAVGSVNLGDQAHLDKIVGGEGNKAGPAKEFAETPSWDLHAMSKVNVFPGPLHGEASANLVTHVVNVGSTTRPGSYRHELGHVLRSTFSGDAPSAKTDMSKAVAEEYDKVQAKVQMLPDGLKTKQTHEWYEEHYGVAGRRSLDNWEENCAEHYRLYHREIYRDKHENGNGKFLAGYRQRHPGWARIWDAHYTAALLHEHLQKS